MLIRGCTLNSNYLTFVTQPSYKHSFHTCDIPVTCDLRSSYIYIFFLGKTPRIRRHEILEEWRHDVLLGYRLGFTEKNFPLRNNFCLFSHFMPMICKSLYLTMIKVRWIHPYIYVSRFYYRE